MNGLSKNSSYDIDGEESWRMPRRADGSEHWLSDKAQLALLRRALDAGGVAIAVLDMADVRLPIVYVNGGLEALTGYSEHECRNRSWEFLLGGAQETIVEHLRSAMQQGVEARCELSFRRKDGSTLWSEFRAIPIPDEHNNIWHCATVFRDMTATRRRLDQLQHRATHDPLTGLANRSLFMDRLHSAVAEAARNATGFSVVFIDVNSFKAVNDRYGHLLGDELLKLVAQRLSHHVRENDIAARLGGDEFALLFNHVDDDSMQAVFQRLTAALNDVYVVEGQALHVGCSAGISFYPTDGSDAASLMKTADLAMYRGKAHAYESKATELIPKAKNPGLIHQGYGHRIDRVNDGNQRKEVF